MSASTLPDGILPLLLVKLLIVVLLLFMVLSLGFGMFFMLKDESGARTAKALTYRIAFSAALIGVLLLALALGVIKPNQSPAVGRMIEPPTVSPAG